ncbi:hypothetical protein N7499_001735 [Penicillium canescens]|nr:hypothetical protein N7499_001735 [Penicillium canescens]
MCLLANRQQLSTADSASPDLSQPPPWKSPPRLSFALSTQISPSLSRNSVPSPFPSIHFQDAPPKRALLISPSPSLPARLFTRFLSIP